MTILCPKCGASIDISRATDTVLNDDPRFFATEHHLPLSCWQCNCHFHGVWEAGKFIGIQQST